MEAFNIFIEDAVYAVSDDYYALMFKTKRLFFKMLKEHKSAEEFIKGTNKIWDKVDHTYMEATLKRFEKLVSQKNIDGHPILDPNAEFQEIFKLTSEGRFEEVERKYKEAVNDYYSGRLKTINNDYIDDNTYLTNLVKKYDDVQATIPYYHENGKIASYHNIADYNSMLYQVNLVRSGWNRTMYDSKILENDLVYLVPHPYACEKCMQYQGRIYSVSGKTPGYPNKQTALDGGVGHPHCQHQFVIYWNKEQLLSNNYDSDEWADKYQTKQKMKALDLKKKTLRNDLKIYKDIDNYDEVDKTKTRINVINKKIREFKKEL